MLHEINLIKSFSILTVPKSFQKHTSAKMMLTKKLTSSEKSSNINLMRNEFVKYTIPTFTLSQVARLKGMRDESQKKIIRMSNLLVK